MTGAVTVETASWLPGRSWWVIAAVVMAVGFLGNWYIAAGALLFLLIQVARPFDFLAAVLIVVGGSTFLNYQSGTLTRQFALLGVGVAYMLFCYARAKPGEALSLCRTDLTRPLAAYVVLSAANAARGFLVGHPAKHVLIEFIPILEIGCAFLVASVFEPRRHTRLAMVPLIGIAYGSAILGFHAFSIIRTHMSGVYFQPFPGMVALLLFNLALRSKATGASLGWIALALPLFLHQFLSYRRGLWLGTLVGLVSSVLIFAAGSRSAGRWRRGTLVTGTLIGAGMAGAVTLALLYDQADILQEAGGRFASIGSTEYSYEAYSNIARLVEYSTVAGLIAQAPLFGHGLGFNFLVKTPLDDDPKPQWWVHENYLLVWLKQGVIGLALFLWMLWAAFWLSARQARQRDDPFESGWLAATAASTAFMAVFSIADFPFDSAETMFFVGLLWGGSMAMAHRGFLMFRWHPLGHEVEPGPRPEPAGTR